MAQQYEVKLGRVIQELQNVRKQLVEQNPEWRTVPRLKQAVDRIEIIEKMCANECLQAETYPVF